MNKAQLRQRARQLAGAELDGLRSDEEFDLLLVEAYEQVGYVTPWKWRETVEGLETEDGEVEYDVPAGIDEIQGIVAVDISGMSMPVPLREVPRRTLLTQVSRDRDHAPSVYARVGNRRIRLAPVPDGVYTLEVFGLAPLAGLVDDEDSPEWASRYHPAVAYLAASVFLDEEGQEELAQARRGRAEEMLADMIDHYQNTKDHTPVVIGGGGRSADGLGYPWLV